MYSIFDNNTQQSYHAFVEKILEKIGYIVTVLIIWIIIVGMMSGTQIDEDSTVNVFLDRTSSKNYELTASTYKQSDNHTFYVKTYYIVSSLLWPNGNISKFHSCLVDDINTLTECISDEGKTYYIKITSFSNDVSS